MRPLGTAGIALANGVASLAGVVFLALALRRRMPSLPYREVLGGWGAMGLAAGIMGIVAWAGARGLDLGRFHGVGGTSLRLFPLIVLCALVYAALLFAFRTPEAAVLKAAVLRRLGRPKG